MNRIFMAIVAVSMAVLASCSVEGGDFNQTNYSYVTNYTGITNLTGITNHVSVAYTNTYAGTLETNDMIRLQGEWLATMVSGWAVREVMDSNSNLVVVMAVVTNYATTISNGGTNGAFTYKFKPDGFVDKIVYNGQGNVDLVYTNKYIYATYSNQYSIFIEMTDPTTVEETAYVTYEGNGFNTNVSLEIYTIKTNYKMNYRLTNIYTETNSTMTVLTNTNNVNLVRMLSKSLVSYIYQFQNDTNVTFRPNTLSNATANVRQYSSGRRNSSGTVNMTITTGTNGSGYVSTSVSFLQNPENEMVLSKIQ